MPSREGPLNANTFPCHFKPATSVLCTVCQMSGGNLEAVTCDKFIDNFHLFLLALQSDLASFSSLF